MKRLLPLLVLVLFIQSREGYCGFTIEASGFGVKRLVASPSGVLATDGKALLLIAENGERLASNTLNLDNAYLLQSAVYSQGAFFLLYQHTAGTVRFVLVALKPDLSVRWTKQFEQVSATFGYAMTDAPNGVLVVGRSCVPGFFVCNIDTNGLVLWNKTFAANNPTAIPGGVVRNDNGYTVAYKVQNGTALQLGMLSVTVSGIAIGNALTTMPGDFFIKGLVKNNDGFATLTQRPLVNINSVLVFDQNLSATQRLDIASTTAVQFTGIAFHHGAYTLSGNAVVPGTSNLDLVYAVFDPANFSVEASLIGTGGYDDARDVKIINNRVWFAGTVSTKAFVASFSNALSKPCNYEVLPLSVTTGNAMSNASNPGAGAGSLFTEYDVLTESTNAALTITSKCTINESIADIAAEPIESFTASYVLYPNPNNGSFNVTVNNASASSLRVIDGAGRTVLQQEVNGHQNTAAIVSPIPGFYVLQITGTDGAALHTERFIVTP